MRTLPVDIEGLDLVLGGGVPVLKRHESFAGESATLVLRGPPGSAKTVLGTQMATSLARQLSVDVAYACVELLPSELAAQHAGVKRHDATERVVEPPFPREARVGACRIYAGVLDLGTPTDEETRFLPAIEELLCAVRDAGGKPGVLVVDSLTDGYHLGGSVPRPFADEVCKMAAELGLILILLEETTNREQSAWCFAADLVIELDQQGIVLPGEEEVLERRIRCTKNRFGPCEPEPHHFEVRTASGVRVYPSPLTHTRSWAVSTLLPGWPPGGRRGGEWGVLLQYGGSETKLNLRSYPFDRSVTMVFGFQPNQVTRVATSIGDVEGFPVPKDILLSFGIEPGTYEKDVIDTYPNLRVIALGTLFPPDRIIAGALAALSRIWTETGSIGRVFIGDLRRINQRWTWDNCQRTIATLLHFFKRAGIPVILVETRQNDLAPPLLSFADIGVEAVEMSGIASPQVTLIGLGIREPLTGLPQPGPVSEGLMLAM